MPIAHKLSKVKKNAAKLTAAMHVKGRKLKQLNRATLREKKLTTRKAKAQEQRKHDFLVHRVFQEAVKGREEEIFDLEFMKNVTKSFVHRHDEEIADLESQKRPGRPAPARLQILLEKRKLDCHIFDTGIQVPDLTIKENVVALKAWNGTSGGLEAIKLVRITSTSTGDEMTD